jgi:ankyrin repeat protein
VTQQLRVALTVDNVNDVDEHCWTALHHGAYIGDVDCVNYCIEMGANVNARNRYGITPLYIASSNGQVNVVRVLLDAGAIVDATDDIGRTPLYFAIGNEYVDISRYLIDWGAKISNVKLNNFIPSISDWVTTFIESRYNCRCAANTIIGIHKYRRTNVTGKTTSTCCD